MAVNFPDSPSNGDTHQGFTYNSTKGVWESNSTVDLSSVGQDIIPATNEQIDLGSSAKKFKDLHLSGTTLNIGSQTIKATATGIEVPELKIGTGTNTVKLTASSDGKLTTTETDSQGNTSAAAVSYTHLTLPTMDHG